MGMKELQKELHETAVSKGFYDDVNLGDARHDVSIAALIGCEVAEMIEAIRKDPDAPCDKPIPLTRREEELADVFIRAFDYAEHHGIDAERVIRVKAAYNATRPLRHGGRRC